MRFNKKASLEISIQAIVIVVLAMTLLGLGLGFIRKQFAGISNIQEEVTEQVKQKILDDLITGDKKVSFPRTEITIDRGSSTVLTVGIRNKKNDPLRYQMRFNAISGPNNQPISDPRAKDNWFQLQKFQDQRYTLQASESEIRNIRLSVPSGEIQGSYFFAFEVIDAQAPTTPPGSDIYAQKDFFIVVKG